MNWSQHRRHDPAQVLLSSGGKENSTKKDALSGDESLFAETTLPEAVRLLVARSVTDNSDTHTNRIEERAATPLEAA